jgi:hypothetical protein
MCGRFKVAHPQIKGATQPNVQEQEKELKASAKRLRVVRQCAPHQFLAKHRKSEPRIVGDKTLWRLTQSFGGRLTHLAFARHHLHAIYAPLR